METSPQKQLKVPHKEPFRKKVYLPEISNGIVRMKDGTKYVTTTKGWRRLDEKEKQQA